MNQTEKTLQKSVQKDGDATITRLSDGSGSMVLTTHQVFPGITLTQNDIHMQGRFVEVPASETLFEINHCREGRMECSSGGVFFYLTPGDLAVGCPSDLAYGSFFPLGHYHGLTITIDTVQAPRCLSCFLDDVNIDPAVLMRRFRRGGRGWIARSSPAAAHLFSELYAVPPEIQKGYFKVKILELLLYLSAIRLDPSDETAKPVSGTQTALAKDVAAYLCSHMESHITLETLSSIFHLSGTQIKNSMKAVYGVSVYAYARTQKMHAAARMLRTGDEPIQEIAGRFGYDNASKFSEAFRGVMGVAPSEYRKRSKTDPGFCDG